eukprot:1186870-Prorocentrum_minimum.AAC.3
MGIDTAWVSQEDLKHPSRKSGEVRVDGKGILADDNVNHRPLLVFVLPSTPPSEGVGMDGEYIDADAEGDQLSASEFCPPTPPPVCEFAPSECEFTLPVCEFAPSVREFTLPVCEFAPSAREFTLPA